MDVSSKYFQPVSTSRKRYLILYGGRSSSKSYTAAQKMAIMCRTEENFLGVMVRQVYNTIKDSQWSKIKSIIEDEGWSDEFHIIKSPLEITHKATGNKIIARGMDAPEKFKSLDDPTVVWMEEALEIGEDAFVKVDTSIRSSKPNTLKQMIITFNPEDESHWINNRFFPSKVSYEKADGNFTYIKSPEPNTLLMHSTYHHNDFCCEEDMLTIQRLIRAYGEDSNYVKVYVYGLWGNALEGLVFERVNILGWDDFPEPNNRKKYGYGLDFGFTNDPTSVTECCLAHGELHFRVLTHKTGLHNRINPNKPEELSIESELDRNEVDKNTSIVADSAEPKSISDIKNCGYNIKGVKKPTVEDSISQMRGYTINIYGSPSMEKESKHYKFKPAKEGSDSKFLNVPIDAFNHDWDSARYWFIENLFEEQHETFSFRR